MTFQRVMLSAFMGLGVYASPGIAVDTVDRGLYGDTDIKAYTQRLLRVEECFPSLDPSWMEAILREEMRDGMRHCAEMDLELKRRKEAANEDVVILRSFEDLIGDLRGEQAGL